MQQHFHLKQDLTCDSTVELALFDIINEAKITNMISPSLNEDALFVTQCH